MKKMYVNSYLPITDVASAVLLCRQAGVEPRSLSAAIAFALSSNTEEIEEQEALSIIASVRSTAANVVVYENKAAARSERVTVGDATRPFRKQSAFEKDLNRILVGETTPEEEARMQAARRMLDESEKRRAAVGIVSTIEEENN